MVMVGVEADFVKGFVADLNDIRLPAFVPAALYLLDE
jgi:hypothetical protein